MNVRAADDFDMLTRLIKAEGKEYVQLREALVKQQTDPWDVASASVRSWELGLAAYVVNQRLAEPAFFQAMDKVRPTHSARMSGYTHGPPGSANARTAFLLEKIWKAPHPVDDPDWRITPEKDRQYAFNTLSQAGLYKGGVGDPALWRALWQHAKDERFRFVALGPLCAQAEPALEGIIREVLQGEDVLVAGYRVKGRCLAGLFHNDWQGGKDLVLEAWDLLRAQSYTPTAVLSTSANRAARELIYVVALDPNESLETRRGAIGSLRNHPHPTDRAFLRKFLAEVESAELKREVVGDLARWFPLEMYREPVREILKASSDPRMIGAAMNALVGGHKAPLPLFNAETGEWGFRRHEPAPETFDVRAWQQDVALLEQLAERDDLPQDMKTRIEQHLVGMYELRRRAEN